HADVADSISQLGRIATSQGHYERAEMLFNDALTIRKATLAPDQVEVAASLHQLASILVVRGDYVKPEPLFREGLAIYERALARSAAPLDADIRTAMADLLDDLGRLFYIRRDYSSSE